MPFEELAADEKKMIRACIEQQSLRYYIEEAKRQNKEYFEMKARDLISKEKDDMVVSVQASLLFQSLNMTRQEILDKYPINLAQEHNNEEESSYDNVPISALKQMDPPSQIVAKSSEASQNGELSQIANNKEPVMVLQTKTASEEVEQTKKAVEALREIHQKQASELAQYEDKTLTEVKSEKSVHTLQEASKQANEALKKHEASQLDDSNHYNGSKNQKHMGEPQFEADVNMEGYSTPSRHGSSKIKSRNLIKAFKKSEKQLRQQMERPQVVKGKVPESRGTIPRYAYNFGMAMQQPNIHYVHSSFERPPVNPCRLACCLTPGSVASGQGLSQRQHRSTKQRKDSQSRPRSNSEAKQNQSVGSRPETFYINTITNNYYQVKRQNALLNGKKLMKLGYEGQQPVNNEASPNLVEDRTTPCSINQNRQNLEQQTPTGRTPSQDTSRAGLPQQHGPINPYAVSTPMFQQPGRMGPQFYGHPHHPYMQPMIMPPQCTCMHGSQPQQQQYGGAPAFPGYPGPPMHSHHHQANPEQSAHPHPHGHGHGHGYPYPSLMYHQQAHQMLA